MKKGKKIVVVMLPFGMCNQLFMYGYGKYIQKMVGATKLYLDYSQCGSQIVHHDATWENTLAHFGLQVDEIFYEKRQYPFELLFKWYICRIFDHLKEIFHRKKGLEYGKTGRFLKWIGIILNSNGDIHKTDEYYTKILKNNSYLLRGIFQNPEVMYSIRETLLEEIKLKEIENIHYINVLSSIENSNSVAVHIRRGDYLNHPLMGVCDDKYYIEAIQEMINRVSAPTIFVFSDDIKYTREIGIEKYCSDVIYVDYNFRDYEELILMSNCKHFVLSNSTFSWFGQFLCKNKIKTVIAPEVWFRPDMKSPLQEESFVYINIK